MDEFYSKPTKHMSVFTGLLIVAFSILAFPAALYILSCFAG